MSSRAVLASLLAALLAPAADARAACWIDRERPTTADSLPVGDARVAAMRAAAQAMNRVLEGAAALHALPEVRFRSTWQVTGHPRTTSTPYGFHLVLWAHGREVWGPGECEVIPQADRVDPHAAIVVQANSVSSTLLQHPQAVRDAQLEAFVEPRQVGRVGKYALYEGNSIVVTADGRVPWVPVRMAEYLDAEERRLVAAAAETDHTLADARSRAGQFDDSGPRQVYETMKKTNPEEAEKLWALIQQTRHEAASLAAAAAAAPPMTNADAAALAALRALRDSLTPAQLQAQAREGYLSTAPHAPIDRLLPLVKVAPGATGDRSAPTRIRVLEIHFSGRGAPYAAMMRQAAESLDWAAIEALLH